MGCYEQCVLREKEGLLAKSSGESFAILQGRSLRRALFFLEPMCFERVSAPSPRRLSSPRPSLRRRVSPHLDGPHHRAALSAAALCRVRWSSASLSRGYWETW